jgi:ankyrin repeat protein
MKPEIWDWLQNNYFSVAQPVLKNSTGMYPLILACQQGRSDVVYFLIDQNAEYLNSSKLVKSGD